MRVARAAYQDGVSDEQPVPQVDDDATVISPPPIRGATHSEWPPEPPPPAEDVEQTEVCAPPGRPAAIIAAVARPVTSSDT